MKMVEKEIEACLWICRVYKPEGEIEISEYRDRADVGWLFVQLSLSPGKGNHYGRRGPLRWFRVSPLGHVYVSAKDPAWDWKSMSENFSPARVEWNPEPVREGPPLSGVMAERFNHEGV